MFAIAHTPASPSAAPAAPRVLLAPMEGLLDWRLREVLSGVGGIDRCVSEFIRVTDQLLPARVFRRIVPELNRGSRTASGVPVRPQLLGSDAACLADNAARLAELGAEGVDLNFGCPAKCVNRHRGGAVLLDEPELVHAIVAEVRRSVPAGVPVSAKMRLGNTDTHRLQDVARGIAAAGADELVVHARTKLQGYKPPAYWAEIARVREVVADLPVVANGEVWTARDAAQALADSGCDRLMLGRGAVADPGLALALQAAWPPGGTAAAAGSGAGGVGGPTEAPAAVDWPSLWPLVQRYAHLVQGEVAPRHQAGRLKQWLHLMRRRHPEAVLAHEAVRTVNEVPALLAALQPLMAGSSASGAALARTLTGADEAQRCRNLSLAAQRPDLQPVSGW